MVGSAMGSCSKTFKPSASGKHGSRVRQRTRSVLVRHQQNTPGTLFTAAALGQVSIVESLLANKINPNERDGVGKTALIWAARNGHSAVVNVLLKKGADIHAKDQCDKTALIWAAMNGHFDTVKVLLMRNADVRMKDTDGYTALELAASNNQTEVMNLLKNAGLIIGSWEVWNDGPRAQAVRDPHSGQLALVQSPEDLLRPAIPQIRRESDETSADPHVPQSAAASDTKMEALPLSTAALIRAAMEGHSSTIELLIREGADVNARLQDGWTPLMLAIWNGHAMAMETLITLGAYLEVKGGNGWTPLMVAVWNGNMEIVQALVGHGADVNAHDVSDKTVLMWAAQKGSTDIVQFLLDHGAGINTKNDKGLTARGYALREGHKDVAKLIEKAGVQELLKRSALRKGPSGNFILPL